MLLFCRLRALNTIFYMNASQYIVTVIISYTGRTQKNNLLLCFSLSSLFSQQTWRPAGKEKHYSFRGADGLIEHVTMCLEVFGGTGYIEVHN